MKKSEKKRRKPQLKSMIILAVVIVIFVIVFLVFKVSKEGIKSDTSEKQQTSSGVYEDIRIESTIFSVTNKCYWSGTDIRCEGKVKDTETKPHATSDIYIDLIAFDNDKKCGYCNNRINLGEFTVGKVKAYSLVCDIGKKADILAKITVSARAAQIFNGC